MAGSSTGGSLISDAKLKQLYATMLQCRLLAKSASRLGRKGRALYSAWLGREALVVGSVIDLGPADTVALAPGNFIAALVKGAELSQLASQLYQPESSLPRNIIHPCCEDGAHLKLAYQSALANQQKNPANVVIAFSSAAATATPAWNKALKSSASKGLPIILVVENHAALELNVKTPKNGLTRITVDGNDVVAVYRVAYESLERVRQGGGAVLIEGTTYLEKGKTLRRTDPLTHMERYLNARGLFTPGWKDQLVSQSTREIEAVLSEARYLPASPQAAND